METSASAPEQDSGASSFAQHSEGNGPTRILRTILKEASVQSPLASAPSHGVFERHSGSKGLKKLFFRTYKQKDELLERIRAQDRFATPQEERGLICWQGHDVPIEINVRVGPLPSYAIIEINGSSLFWWRTQEALNFVPKVGEWRDTIFTPV